MQSLLQKVVRCTPMACAIGVLACFSVVASAREVVVTPADDLQEIIRESQAGDTLVLRAGHYGGSIIIDRSIAVTGESGAVIDGLGKGTVITVSAPRVSVSNLTIINSGAVLASEDSGIYVESEAEQSSISDNHLEKNLIGIYLKGTKDALVENNTIIGREDLRLNERGNGVQLWNAVGSMVVGNYVRYGRDGVFVTTSDRNIFRNNRFEDLRFAVHYMFTNNSEISGNVSIRNHVGFAMMYSHHLKMFDNISEGDRDRGMFFNYANYSDISNNEVRGTTEKCVFIYNATGNRIFSNLFRNCAIGIHFTAGSEKNQIFENAFVNNRKQVKYVGTRHIDWSMEGRGNYWSDNSTFDLDGDGIADQPYQPNNIVDQIIWRYPLSKLLFNSPAMELLQWAQSQFPSLHPGGVTDSAPLISMPSQFVSDS